MRIERVRFEERRQLPGGAIIALITLVVAGFVLGGVIGLLVMTP